MDYLKFVSDLIEQIDKEAHFVIVHNNNVLDFEMYDEYEIGCILEGNKTTNLYEAINKIDKTTSVVVYAMIMIEGKEQLPQMITVGILNKDGKSWTLIH